MNNHLETVGIWNTFSQSTLSAKIIILGLMVTRLFGFLQIFLVLFLISRGYSHQQTIIALAVYGGGAVVGSLIGGNVSERFGIRATGTCSMGITAGLIIALLYISDFTNILIVIVLISLCTQLFRPASTLLLARQVPPERQTMIFAIYRLGANIGATCAPIIGYTLYHWSDDSFIYLFWLEAAIASLYSLLMLIALPRKSINTELVEVVLSIKGYRQVLTDRRFVLYLLATFCHSAVFIQYLTTLPMYIKDKGIALFWYTLAVSLNGFIVICFELLITKITQHREKRKMLTFGFVLVGSGVAFYALPIGPAAIIIGTIIWSLGEIISGPAFIAYPANAGPDNLRAYYLGCFHFMFSFGTALGPMIGGWLYLVLDTGVWPILALGSYFSAIVCFFCVRDNSTFKKIE